MGLYWGVSVGVGGGGGCAALRFFSSTTVFKRSLVELASEWMWMWCLAEVIESAVSWISLVSEAMDWLVVSKVLMDVLIMLIISNI